jgi:hypothetical protein
MVTFNQLSFNAAQTPTEFIAELEKLRDQFAQASKDNIIDEETATDVEYQITKAVQQAKKSNPDKKAIIRRLSTVKVLLEKITVASEWVTVVAGAIDAIKNLF